MTQYDNTNRGVLFDNDRKESDSHPDMKGKLNIGGVDHWFNAWWKDSRNGGEFLSLSLGKPCEHQQAAPQQRQQAPEPERRGNRPSGRLPAPTAPQPAANKPTPATAGGSGFEDMDDDIPF